jgi:hypothetical protein
MKFIVEFFNLLFSVESIIILCMLFYSYRAPRNVVASFSIGPARWHFFTETIFMHGNAAI